MNDTPFLVHRSSKDEVQIVIYAKKGIHGSYVEALSSYPNQRELLLDKDCLYRVLSNKDNIVELEVIQ